MLELYRSPLTARRSRRIAAGDVVLLDLGDDVVAINITTGDQTTRIIVNLGQQDSPIPSNSEMIIASEPAITETVPTDHAVWLALR
jgi:hypothetical protein